MAEKKIFAGLPEPVASKYYLLQEPGVFITKYPDRQTIDLKKITLEEADRLYEKGLLPMLKPKKGRKRRPLKNI